MGTRGWFTVLALVTLTLCLSGCYQKKPHRGHAGWHSKRWHPAKIVHHKQICEPVFRVKGARNRYTAYDSSLDLWLNLNLNNGSFQVDSGAARPPAYDPKPAAAIPDTALSQVSRANPASAAPIEEEEVSEGEIATWEGEGGNLGPSEAQSGESESEASGGDAGESGDGGGGDASGGDGGGGDGGGGAGGGGGD
jgi:uncharacterized membrane protein YgcG